MNEQATSTGTVKDKKSAGKERRALKNSAFETLKELIDKQPDQKFKDALKTLRPSLYGESAPGTRVSSMSKFLDAITEKKQINEEEVFKMFKIGRKDCNGYIRKHLKKAVPAERKWIKFDPTTGIYSLAGQGPNPPKDWKGFTPAKQNIDLNKAIDLGKGQKSGLK